MGGGGGPCISRGDPPEVKGGMQTEHTKTRCAHTHTPSQSHSGPCPSPTAHPPVLLADNREKRTPRTTPPAPPRDIINVPRGPAPRHKPRPGLQLLLRAPSRERLPEALGALSCLAARPVLPARLGYYVDNHLGSRGPEGPGAADLGPSRRTLCRPRRALSSTPSLLLAPPGRWPGLRFPEGAAADGRAHFRRRPATWVPAGQAGWWARRPAGRGRLGARRARAGWVCFRDPGGVCAHGGDMRGTASARARGLGSPPQRGVPRTKPGAGRGRSAGTPVAFPCPARGRPRARRGLTSRGQRGAATTGPENRGERDRWPGGWTGTN